ncbi:MAG: DUF4350 domain-containing protein [Polyangiaceae bacterium]|nr:DUF4350 domain-containing protein [Polyangiaceae bacterium]
MKNRFLLLTVPFLASALANGCSKADDGDSNCAAGTELCPCGNDHSCDDGLVCGSDICVRLQGSDSTGGTGPTGTGGQGAATETGGTSTAGEGPVAGGGESPTGGGQGGTEEALPPRGECTQVGFVGADQSDSSSAPDLFVGWLEERGAIVTRIDATASLSPATISPLHVLIVGNMTARADEGSPYTADEIAAVEAWVNDGGGLVTLAGYTGNEQAAAPADSLLEPLGLGYDYEGRGSGVFGDGEPPMVATVPEEATHETVDEVTSLGVYFAYPVTGTGTVVLEREETALAMASEVGQGHVLACGDEYSTFVNRWEDQSELEHEAFWTNVLDWMTASLGCRLGD